MGLRADIQTALTEAFDGDLSDVVAPFNLVQATQGVYNPATGITPVVETLTPSRGVFVGFEAEELGNTQIKSTDIKLIVNGADLAAAPKVDDIIRTTVDYTVIQPKKILEETTVIAYEIQIRKVES